MIIDLEQAADGQLWVNSAICIVGGGAAGVTIAKSLLDRGLDVCLLEAGGMKIEQDQQALLDGESIGAPIRLDEGRYRRLGGATGAWTGRCAELDPIDFERRDWVPGSGWPIGLDDLKPYYRAAEAMCGFEEPWRSNVDELDRLATPDMADEAIQPFLWRFAPHGRNRYQDWGSRYLAELRRSRHAKLILHANLTRIEDSADDDRIRAIVARSANGGTVRVEARHFILCCGGIENARLLLNAAITSRGPLRAAGQTTGRYFMQHPRVKVADVVLDPAGAGLQNLLNRFVVRSGTEYETGFVLRDRQQRSEQLLNASAVIRYAPRPGSLRDAVRQLRGGTPLRKVRMTPPSQGVRPGAFCNDVWRYARGLHPILIDPVASIIVDVEQAPDPASRIALAESKDSFGLNKVRVDWRIADLERRTVAHFTGRIRDMFARQGWGTLLPIAGLDESGGLTAEHMMESYHHIGATRMSATSATGTVDADCRVHQLANLHVCGASVMPTGGHANPTFTIVALALRLADRIARLSAPMTTPTVQRF
ncbi:MAG: GMC family oxidoreductase [Pseudomonadota bacterium]